MRIRVDAIPAAGRTHSATLEDDWARVAATEALEGTVRSLAVEMSIRPPRGREVEAEVRAEATWDVTCDRCGIALVQAMKTEVSLRYLPAGTELAESDDEEGVELAEDELDLGWYEDGSLVLAGVLSEALALATPSRMLCEDLAGCDARTEALLAEAGEPPVGHPGFAALKNFKN